jgi:hypothetical protein
MVFTGVNFIKSIFLLNLSETSKIECAFCPCEYLKAHLNNKFNGKTSGHVNGGIKLIFTKTDQFQA